LINDWRSLAANGLLKALKGFKGASVDSEGIFHHADSSPE